MKHTNKLVILGLVAVTVTAKAQTTLALYQRENDNSTYIWKIGPTGQPTEKIRLNKSIHPDANSFAVGISPFEDGKYAIAFLIPGTENGRFWIFNSDGTLYSNGGLTSILGGSSAKLIGIGHFAPGFYSDVILYRGDTQRFYYTHGNDGDYLNLNAIDRGTYTDPVGVVDADGDGDGDILMRDPATGFVRPILFAGRTATAMGSIIDPENPGREIIGTSDVDGNGTLDLFFRKPGPIENGSWDTQIKWYDGSNLIFGPIRIQGDRRRTLLAVGQG